MIFDMKKAKCTENEKGFVIKDFTIFEGHGNEKPNITFTVPLEYCPEEYEGCGYFSIGLEGILKTYLSEFWGENHGERTLKVVSLLREYATKIEAEWKNKKKL